MPIFISYAHSDKDFVDKLAIQLVRQNVHVWLDRWELTIGDSLIDRIQDAVDGASALLVVLTPESVQSEWCKKELSSGLLRELEEKRVVVMPLMLRDCQIPIFARGKLYADFRTNFDDGLRSVLTGIAKVTSASLSRIQEDKYHVDWSINSALDPNGNVVIKATFIQIPKDQPYTCLTEIIMLLDARATTHYKKKLAKEGPDSARLEAWESFAEAVESAQDIRPLLEDAEEKKYTIPFMYGQNTLLAFLSSRRLGEDTGKDILMNVTGLVNESRDQMRRVLTKPAGA
jgi:hypothetical protein